MAEIINPPPKLSKTKTKEVKRIYFGNDFLDNEKTDEIMNGLLLDPRQYRACIIYINSTGGNIDNGMAVLDAIGMLSVPTLGVAIGNCMSMAVNVFLACKNRVCTPSTYFMIHQSAFEEGLKGQIETIKENIRVQEDMDAMLNGYIFKNTLITKETLGDYFKHKSDMYFNAKEAKEYGIVSNIIKNEKEIYKLIEGLK